MSDQLIEKLTELLLVVKMNLPADLRKDAAETIAGCAAAVLERDRLRERVRVELAMQTAADRVQGLAFKMPPPNEYTPDFVALADLMRSVVNDQSVRGT